MSRDQTYAEITPIFQDVFDDDDLIPNDNMTAKDVAEWDSLSHIRLICSVEEHFSIRFSTTEINDLRTVGDFIALIQDKKG